MPALDLSEIPVIDQHCHAFLREWYRIDLPTFHARFTEGGQRVESTVPTLVYYRWALREMRRALDLPEDADEETILAARRAQADEYLAVQIDESGLAGLLIDDGYPPSDNALSV